MQYESKRVRKRETRRKAGVNFHDKKAFCATVTSGIDLYIFLVVPQQFFVLHMLQCSTSLEPQWFFIGSSVVPHWFLNGSLVVLRVRCAAVPVPVMGLLRFYWFFCIV